MKFRCSRNDMALWASLAQGVRAGHGRLKIARLVMAAVWAGFDAAAAAGRLTGKN